jgi:hypothetical protein
VSDHLFELLSRGHRRSTDQPSRAAQGCAPKQFPAAWPVAGYLVTHRRSPFTRSPHNRSVESDPATQPKTGFRRQRQSRDSHPPTDATRSEADAFSLNGRPPRAYRKRVGSWHPGAPLWRGLARKSRRHVAQKLTSRKTWASAGFSRRQLRRSCRFDARRRRQCGRRATRHG